MCNYPPSWGGGGVQDPWAQTTTSGGGVFSQSGVSTMHARTYQENNQRCSRCRMVGVKGSITSPCQSSESRFGVISSFYSKWVGQRCSYTNKSINIHHHFLNQRYVDQYCNGIRSPTLELKAWIEIPIEPRFSGWFEILRKYIVFT